MENKAATLDLFLTEVSFELLGNEMFDINGKKQSSLMGLFKAVDSENFDSCNNDLLMSLKQPTSLKQLKQKSCRVLLDEQYSYMLNEVRLENDTEAIEARIKEITNDKPKFYGATTECQIRKGSEHTNLLMELNKKKIKSFQKEFLDTKKNEAVLRYYEWERNELFTNCMDTIRLIKYILRDPRNAEQRTDLIASLLALTKYLDDLTL